MTSTTAQPISQCPPPPRGEFGTHRYFLRRRLWRDLAAAAGHVSGRLLDLGCGIKPYEPLFAQRVSRHIGFDLPQSLDSRGCRADVTGSAARLPFDNATFDTVLCTQMLDDFPEPSVILGEAARVLKPGGALLLTVNQLYPVHDPPHDFYRFTRYGLEHQINRCGLRVDYVHATGGQWMTAGILIIQRIWAIWSKVPLLNKLTFLPMLMGFMTGLSFEVMDRLDPSWGGAPNLLVVAKKD